MLLSTKISIKKIKIHSTVENASTNVGHGLLSSIKNLAVKGDALMKSVG